MHDSYQFPRILIWSTEKSGRGIVPSPNKQRFSNRFEMQIKFEMTTIDNKQLYLSRSQPPFIF